MGNLSTGSGTYCSPLSVRGDDYYQTPREATYALLKAFKVPNAVYEPACGAGAIVNILRAEGHTVHASDLVDRGCPDSSVSNFLEQTKPIPGVDVCLTNPPFKIAHEFIRKSRELYPMTIMLLRLAFLESMKRSDILDAGDLSKVMLFRRRLPFMHRENYTGKRNSNSAMPFCWMVWSRDHHSGPATVERIDWERLPKDAPQLIFTQPKLAPTPIEAYIESVSH
jgi:hypothetical protein